MCLLISNDNNSVNSTKYHITSLKYLDSRANTLILTIHIRMSYANLLSMYISISLLNLSLIITFVAIGESLIIYSRAIS